MTIPIERLDDYRWQIPAGSKPGMKVPAIIYADEKLLEQIRHDLSLEQAANADTLSGVRVRCRLLASHEFVTQLA